MDVEGGCRASPGSEVVPSGDVKIAIENGPVEIVDLPSYKMVDLSIVFWYVYQRVTQSYVSLPEGISY